MNESRHREYERLKELVEKRQGRLHPEILSLPEEEQILLFQEALDASLALGKEPIDEFLSDLDDRLALVKRLSVLMQ